ncbi:Crp/Fnr family transcriptional regulator [Teredinibacter sp. KSP-S5-2]|uniref:Crp/Fnr family transcriptional regulator n=1 Tax=Teredinibacter sp. KSP-S5-2 TaxID=3034506 RepID=UPI002934A354|nr:Crp/Fnr family transcriptional regulator [Teredinibacter sp. KSP-S5-2]WNO08025.1 Crp/Fnr family transcriptional regulator [Teredinibacter sp. KSP-S5-2]
MNKQIQTLKHNLSKIVQFSDQAWLAAAQEFQLINYTANEHIFKAGETVDHVYFILKGLARYYYLTQEGKEFNKSFSTTGQILGSISSSANSIPCTYSTQCLQDMECLSLTYKTLKILSNRFPEWNQFHLYSLEQLAIKKEIREADFLLLTAEERYTKFLEDFAHIENIIPNYHIASYIGITEVALSRIRKSMGLINPG